MSRFINLRRIISSENKSGSGFSLSYALHFLKHDRKKGLAHPLLGPIIGICLSLVPLITVLFVSDAMIEGITRRFLETWTGHLQVMSYDSISPDEWAGLSEKLSALDETVHVNRERQGFGLAYTPQGRIGLSFRAVPPDLYSTDEGFREYLEIKEGEWDLSSPGSAAIGLEIARTLQLKPGDEFRVLTGKVLDNGLYIPRVSRFTVSAVVSSGYQELDRLWVFIPLATGQKIIPENQADNHLTIKVDDPFGSLAAETEALEGIIPPPFHVRNWFSLSRAQYDNYQSTRAVLLVIMSLIVLVAVVNISSSLRMIVKDREKEIGILKNMGMSPSQISVSFVFLGVLTGLSGGVAGCLIGTVTALRVNEILGFFETVLGFFSRMMGRGSVDVLNSRYYLDYIPVQFEFTSLLVILLATAVLAALVSLGPARNAGRLKPLEILRKHG